MKNIFLIGTTFLFIQIASAGQFTDLYTDLMPEIDRVSSPLKTQKSFKVHLLDSFQKFPALSDLKNQNIDVFGTTKTFNGTMTYVYVFKKKYKYDVVFQNNRYIFNVRIHFNGATPKDYIEFYKKIKLAEKEWNNSRLLTDFNYEFKFSVELDIKKAHYSVIILDSTRGPYDTAWGRDWDGAVVAHEIGHMMGLGDEYQTATSVSDCLSHSKMCSTKGLLMKHHYYFILRRLLK